MVPEAQKELLWKDILKHFTLPDDVDTKLVKSWTLSQMATQLQNFKKMLSRKYINKDLTPDWNEYPKVQNHWKSFVDYKKVKTMPRKVSKPPSVPAKRGNTTIVLVEVVTRLQFPSGVQWKKT